MTHKIRGFSLVELLMVVVILMILMAIAGRALVGVQQGYRLSQAGTEAAGWFEYARKRAIAANRLVELRIIQPSPGSSFRHVAVLVIEPDGSRRMASRTFTLPEGLFFPQDPDLSPLLELPAGTEPVPVPGLGSSYAYRSFRFRPDGTTDLPWTPTNPARYFVTLRDERDRASPPDNYFTIEVDPLNGRTRTHRP